MRHRIRAYGARSATVCLLCMIVLFARVACAEGSYTKTAEMICGDTKIKVITECFDDSLIPPSCTKQRFELTDQQTKKTVAKSASGKLVDSDLTGPSLGALATRIQCVAGKTQPYLIVWYYTGGNCEQCEWQEILDLMGKRLGSNQTKTKNSLAEFDATWTRLGLGSPRSGGNVPGSQHMEIPLRRKD